MRISMTVRLVAALAAVLLACAARAAIFPPVGTPYPTGATAGSGPGFVMPEQVALADFNADGAGDLAIANYGTETLGILRGVGNGTFQPVNEFVNVGFGPFGIAVGDVNGDGKPDIVLTDNSNVSVAVLINDYGGPSCAPQPAPCFRPAVFYTTDALPTAVALADMNGDGILDIVVGTAGTAGIDVLLGNGTGGVGDGTFGAKTAYNPGISTAYILVADFTGDGKLDVAATDGNSPGALTIYPGNGLGALLAGTPFPAGDRPTQMVKGDFNGDGKVDIAVVDQSDITAQLGVTIMQGNGLGTFNSIGFYPVLTSMGGIDTADFNGDGHLDLILAVSGTGNLDLFLGNGDGTFQAPLPFAAGSQPAFALAGDFNGDGKPDAAVTNRGGDNISIFVDACVSPTATVTGDQTICAGQPATIQAALTGQGPWTVNWSDGAIDVVNPPLTADVRVVSPVVTTLYTVQVVADATGCAGPGTGSATVTVNPLPAPPTASNNGPVCVGSPIQLTAVGAAGAYLWAGPNGFTSNLQNPTIPAATLADAGLYTVTVTVAGCTSGAGRTTVTVNPAPPSPAASNNGPICAGQTLQLTASAVAGATYSWTGPNGFTSTLQNPSIPGATAADSGAYSVVAIVAGCPSPAATTNAVVNSIPAAPTAGNNGPVCVGSPIQLTASSVAGATYAWTGPNGFTSVQQNPIIASATAADAGTYSVTVTVSGCTSLAGTTSIAVNPIPASPAASNNGPVCAGQTLQLTASAVAGATYAWTGPNGFTSTLQNPSIAGATPADSGAYSVVATVGGCASLPATTNVTVSPNPAAPTASNNGPVCPGQAILLSASTVAGATYSWTGPNGFASSLQNPTIASASAANAGTYSVHATVSGCTSGVGQTTVSLAPPPSAVITAPASVAANSSGNSASVPFAGSGATYTWSIVGGTIDSGNGGPAVSFSAGASGSITLSVSVRNAAGCQAGGAKTIAITGGTPTCTLTCSATVPATTVAGSSVAFHATSAATGCTGTPSYLWDFGDGATAGGADVTHAYASAGTFTWTLSVSEAGATSCVRTGTITVSGAPPPCIIGCSALVPSAAQVGVATAFTAVSNAVQCGTTATYSWDFGDGATSSQPAATHTYTSAGNYVWQLTVSTPAGACIRRGAIVVTTEPTGCALIASASAPIEGIVGEPVSFDGSAQEFDCTGTLLYEWNFGDATTSSDPTTQHVYTAPGTYFWTFSVSIGAGATVTQSGYVTITAPSGGGTCTPPEAPENPGVEPIGNPGGILTVTDYIEASWDPPATGPTPTLYEYWINGEAAGSTFDTTAILPPRGDDRDPITLFVEAFDCSPSVGGPIAASAIVSFDAPHASFTFAPDPATVGLPVTFTDSSSPQATSWLWLYDDGTQDFDVQSPTHVFTTAGTHTVALVASNGSGSDVTERSVDVRAAAAGPAAISIVKRLHPVSPGRWSLPGVSVEGLGTAWLTLRPLGTSRGISFLRLRDDSGRLLCERRLVADPGRVSRFDLGAWGARGRVSVELVSPDRLDAAILTSRASARKDGSDE